MPHPLLTGWWSNIAIASYAVPPAVLAPFLPRGPGGMDLELDTRTDISRDGRPAAVISLIAQQCVSIRVMGVKWPFFNRFDAIYARTYVRQGQARGTVYLREIVPSRLVAWGGRRAMNQPSLAAEVRGEIRQQTLSIAADYALVWPTAGFDPQGRMNKGSNGAAAMEEYSIRVVGSKPPFRPGAKAIEHWLTERPFVFGQSVKGDPFVYEIIHPSWGVYPNAECTVELDFARTVSPDLGFLSGLKPDHATLAVGSEVAIFPKRASIGVRWGVRRTEARR